jgi:DnaJ-domain-containing protein 1
MLEQAFSGFAALPPAGPKPWREVLGVHGVSGEMAREVARTRYRELAAEAHPDRAGGSHERMAEINAAYEAAKLELGGSS